MRKLGFIGAGTVGSALARKLSERGYSVCAISSRTLASAQRLAAVIPAAVAYLDAQTVADEVDLVFITTPDGAIPGVVSAVKWRSGQAVVHCSGADSVDVLQAARQAGALVGVIHPLQTFASVDQAMANLAGSTFSLEAEEPLLRELKKMATDLDGRWVVLGAGDKVLYHAAAVIACNYAVTLVKLAADLWAKFGVPQGDAVKALLPLLKGTVNNLERVGLPGCLTGPIARGDAGTLTKHLAALEQRAPELLPVYRELGRQTVPISLAKGKIDEGRAVEMTRLLTGVQVAGGKTKT